MSRKKAILAIEDGTYFYGRAFGAEGETFGELVFNTSMTGYQEILTDPSYKGQIVVMTYPHIGNYGVNPEDEESERIQVEGFVVREYSRIHSNWRATASLEDYMRKYSIVGIEGVDTRSITKLIREKGAMRAGISTEDLNPESMLEKIKNHPPIAGMDLVKGVTIKQPFNFYQRFKERFNLDDRDRKFKVVAYDGGIKWNILRKLHEVGADIWVVPADYPAEEVLSKFKPDGIFVSNGPGDPEPVGYLVENVRKLIGKVPMFGICLGHQIISLALGGKTYKMKFGHRGANQPVKDLKSGKVLITAQNHSFAVDPSSLPEDVEITHINLNDNTVEGIAHKKFPLFSVQYHPENSPGPHDAFYHFSEFARLILKETR